MRGFKFLLHYTLILALCVVVILVLMVAIPPAEGVAAGAGVVRIELFFGMLLTIGTMGATLAAFVQKALSHEISFEELAEGAPFKVLSVMREHDAWVYVIRRFNDGIEGENVYLLRVADSIAEEEYEIGVVYIKKKRANRGYTIKHT